MRRGALAAVALAAGFIAAALVFSLWPGIDLAVSAAFRGPAAAGGWVGLEPLPEAIRIGIWRGIVAATIGFALLTALALVLGARARVPARLWGFALLAMALGPGLVVNGLLKANWGRARPRSLAEFGGEAAFTPALDPTGPCLDNCSFVSGEAAGAATLALVLWLLVGRRLPGTALRALAALGLAGLALGIGALRVAAGGHFLSDVIFAILLSAALTLALWRAMRVEPLAARLTPANLRADLGRLLPGRWRRK